MTVKCVACGKYIFSIWADTCPDCVEIKANQNRRDRERRARNERTLMDIENQRKANQELDNDLLQNATLIYASQNMFGAPAISGLGVRKHEPEEYKPAEVSSYTPSYSPSESCSSSYDSSSYSSSSDSSSSSSSSGCD